MFRRLLENIAKGLVIWSRMMTGIYVQSGLNWVCPQLFVAHVLQPSFILIVVKHELHSKPFCLRCKSLNRTNYIFYIFILRRYLTYVICALWWRVASSSSFNPGGQLLVLFRAHSTLGTAPPLPPPPPSSVPALPLCSIHPELPTPPFVAMATNAGDSPALWVKHFGRLLSPVWWRMPACRLTWVDPQMLASLHSSLGLTSWG